MMPLCKSADNNTLPNISIECPGLFELSRFLVISVCVAALFICPYFAYWS